MRLSHQSPPEGVCIGVKVLWGWCWGGAFTVCWLHGDIILLNQVHQEGSQDQWQEADVPRCNQLLTAHTHTHTHTAVLRSNFTRHRYLIVCACVCTFYVCVSQTIAFFRNECVCTWDCVHIADPIGLFEHAWHDLNQQDVLLDVDLEGMVCWCTSHHVCGYLAVCVYCRSQQFPGASTAVHS